MPWRALDITAHVLLVAQFATVDWALLGDYLRDPGRPLLPLCLAILTSALTLGLALYAVRQLFRSPHHEPRPALSYIFVKLGLFWVVASCLLMLGVLVTTLMRRPVSPRPLIFPAAWIAASLAVIAGMRKRLKVWEQSPGYLEADRRVNSLGWYEIFIWRDYPPHWHRPWFQRIELLPGPPRSLGLSAVPRYLLILSLFVALGFGCLLAFVLGLTEGTAQLVGLLLLGLGLTAGPLYAMYRLLRALAGR